MSDNIIVSLFYFLIIILIAYFVGKNRRVGIFWSIFFGVFLSPIGGIIITLSSSKKAIIYSPRSKMRINLSNASLFLGAILLLGSLFYLFVENNSSMSQTENIRNLWVSIGMIGIGVYTNYTGR
jgi:hypothetical protein